MLRYLRVLGTRSALLDLPTAAAVILSGFLLAAAVLTTAVTLTLALPYEGGPTGFGAPPSAGNAVIMANSAYQTERSRQANNAR